MIIADRTFRSIILYFYVYGKTNIYASGMPAEYTINETTFFKNEIESNHPNRI